MIQIHTTSNPDITKNGIIINPISCEINPVLNGENELVMEFAIDEDGVYKYIQNNNFISVPTPDFTEPQLYRIYDTKKSMSNYSITAYARHLQFDLAKSVIFNKNVQGNGQQVLTKLLEDTNFKGTSDSNITDIRQYKMRNVINVLNGSEEDSFINIWGGEISCNNYNLAINQKRGNDKGIIRVTFGYNLEDIEEEITFDDVITRLYPYSGDLALTSSTPYVDSPLIANIGVLEESIEFSDIKVKENADDTEGFATRALAEAEMIKRCKKLYDKGLDKITANYVVKMQDLSKTTEYKRLGYDVLEKICLGDTVHCYNKNIDIEVSTRCISYKWDCINEEYVEIELGQFISNYVNMQNNRLDNLYRTIQLTEQNILLRVDSLDNNLHSQIELTAGQIRSEVVDVKNGLETSITETAKDIRLEANNTKENLQASINVNADAITQRVTNSTFNTYKTQTATDISQKVTKGTEFSSELKQNVSAFQFLFNDASSGKTEINSSGIIVYKGGLKVVNSSGVTVMWVNSNGVVMLNDLYFDNAAFEEDSNFASSLANMKRLSLSNVAISGQLIIDEHDFYLYKDGDGGYDLEDYVNRRIREFCEDQGWELT